MEPVFCNRYASVAILVTKLVLPAPDTPNKNNAFCLVSKSKLNKILPNTAQNSLN